MPKHGNRLRISPARAIFDGWWGTSAGPPFATLSDQPTVSGVVPGQFVGRSANDGVWLKLTVGASRVKTPDGVT